MKVLMVEPGKVPYAAEIGEGLEPLQAAVGGDIQAVYGGFFYTLWKGGAYCGFVILPDN